MEFYIFDILIKLQILLSDGGYHFFIIKICIVYFYCWIFLLLRIFNLFKISRRSSTIYFVISYFR